MRLICVLIILCGLPLTAQEPKPLRELPFSSARKAGNTLYLSGSVARKPDGSDAKESVTTETHQIMQNLGRVLKEHGYTYDDVVKATVFLEDIEDYHEMNKAYAHYFKSGKYPARECVGGIKLVFGFKVEISFIAYKEP